MTCFKVKSIAQGRTANVHVTFKRRMKIKEYLSQEYALMPMTQVQELWKLCFKANMNTKKTAESKRTLNTRIPALEEKTSLPDN